ncbi:MAG TPA: hypothetical protein VJ755_07990 [Gemmatimonadales bacterium]|nr:hypothetical protein [Gemmatimonadales bacterium]
MARLGRIVVVTIGLVGAGIVFGALAGGTAFALAVVLATGRISTALFEIGAVFGAPLGGITAPVLAWVLLRRVPLGRMFLVCSVGTALGGVVGWFATAGGGNPILNPIAGAFIGCVVAAIALWHRARVRLA